LPSTAEPEAAARRRRALLVATGDYSDPGLAGLRAPTGDVDALAAVLEDGAIGEFEVTRLVDRPTEDLKKEIEGFFGDARRDDLLLLYFSCHGVLSQSRRFYFATATTALNLLRATAIEDSFVNDVMQHSRARSIVLILDCCHSGAFGRGLTPKSALTVDVEHRFEGRGRVTLSASTELEYAFEATDPATGISELDAAVPGSLFTRCVVEGLATGEADMDRDGTISVDELYEYVCQRMRDRATHQTPGMAGDVRGEIVIARSRRGAGLPEPLQEAIASPLVGVREGAVSELAALLGSHDAPVAEAAREALTRLKQDDSRRVRVRAAEALAPGRAPPREEQPPEVTTVARPRVARRRPRWWMIAAPLAAVAAVVGAVLVLGGGGEESGTVAYDFDDDGAQEIVIGPVQSDSSLVLIHPGTEDGRPRAISAAAAGIPEASPGQSFGAGITSADFDGDDRADLAIGVPDFNVVAILYGGETGVPSPRRQRIERSGDVPSGRFGDNLLGRDLNGDGYADLVVSAPGSGDEPGAIQILYGAENGVQTDAGTRVIEPPDGVESGFGERLRSGDIDGDGNVDLVEGAPDDTPGHLSFCPGTEDGVTYCNLMPAQDDDAGTSALAVADVNGDERADIVQADEMLPSGVGGVRLWLGQEDGPAQTPQLITAEMLGLEEVAGADAALGSSVDAGPYDADEYADIVTGAPGTDEEEGAVVVIRGSSDGYAQTGAGVVRGSDVDSGAHFGSNLALLRLPGGDGKVLDLVVAANGVEVERSVAVADGEEARPLPGIVDVVQGSGGGLRLGRTAGR